nr:j domain-containing protein 1 [Quercus suber]
MLLRHHSVLKATYTSIHSINLGPGSSTSSYESTRPHCRTYASIASDNNGATRDSDGKPREYVWPEAKKGAHPSPYEIFAMKHNAEYSKARFYELVKIYHPDLSGQEGNIVPSDIRNERYRLIVAAHGILSDPVKRAAYDRFGAGWNGRASEGMRDGSSSGRAGPFSQSWSDPNDPIFANATWEDWERFYARRAREADPNGKHDAPQSPLYLRNSHFIALVGVVAFIASSANYNRAQDAGTYFVEQRDIVHDRAAKELRKVRQETSGMKARDERIQWFMRQREAAMGHVHETDIEALRDEKANRVLADGEICRSDAVSERDM